VDVAPVVFGDGALLAYAHGPAGRWLVSERSPASYRHG
jgi:hypothetical protein